MDELISNFNAIIFATEESAEKAYSEIENELCALNENWDSISAKEEISDSKRNKKLSTISDTHDENTDINNLPSQVSGNNRPTRPAKLTAALLLKEPSTKVKLRREDVYVKLERMSYNTIANSTGEIRNSVNCTVEIHSESTKRKSSDDDLNKTENPSRDQKIQSKKVKVENNETVIIQSSTIKVELLSEDETEAEKMPPPSIPPAKAKRGRKKKKHSNDSDSSNTPSKSMIIPKPIQIKPEKLSIDTLDGNSRPKRSKKLTKTDSTDSIDSTKTLKNNKNDSKSQNSKNVVADTTMESVYEDAICDNASTKLSTDSSKQKFLSPVEKESNSTFVVPKVGDETFEVRTINNETVVINKEENKRSASSIITDDNSLLTDDESTKDDITPTAKPEIKKQPLNKKNGKINLLERNDILSPVKAIVEQFERQANAIGSPIPQRATRTKTRTKESNENNDVLTPNPSRIPKPATPSTEPHGYKYGTPKDMYISTLANQNLKKNYNSASKLAHVQKPLSKSISRENSIEDLRKGAQGLLALAEEKKKKREEKQRLAQAQREAKEKERVELAEKAAREREEKHKKALLEKEEKLRQENAKKKLMREKKLQEAEIKKKIEETQKREEERLLEIQRRNERLLAEKLKKEREILQMTKMERDIQKDLLLNMQKNKEKQRIKQYDFDQLNSGDSTDEETKKTNKRPPPPEWSLAKNRAGRTKAQSYIPFNIIDNFFSIKPMTIDLKEIFPNIHEKHLKRNSSMIWNTPPRYSQLPKY